MKKKNQTPQSKSNCNPFRKSEAGYKLETGAQHTQKVLCISPPRYFAVGKKGKVIFLLPCKMFVFPKLMRMPGRDKERITVAVFKLWSQNRDGF